MEKISLAEKFAAFDEAWTPKLIGAVNDFDVKIAKLRGSFVWHKHDEEDELFLVVKGHLDIKMRDAEVALDAGDLFIVPHGVEHMPVADGEALVLLFERHGTLNTGNVRDGHTVLEPERI